MKKIIFTLIICFSCLALVACDNKQEEDFETDLSTIYDSIMAAQPDQAAEEILLFLETDEELLDNYYPGLSEIPIKEKRIYMHPLGFACEIALVEVENIEDVEKVKAVFETRIEKGKTEMLCDAGAEDIWRRRAEIQSKGRYVCMIVLPDECVIPENIMDL